jgi:hypothetical protein
MPDLNSPYIKTRYHKLHQLGNTGRAGREETGRRPDCHPRLVKYPFRTNCVLLHTGVKFLMLLHYRFHLFPDLWVQKPFTYETANNLTHRLVTGQRVFVQFVHDIREALCFFLYRLGGSVKAIAGKESERGHVVLVCHDIKPERQFHVAV